MALSLLPAQHPQRVLLHNEIHARPAEIMQAPLAITHMVMHHRCRAARSQSRTCGGTAAQPSPALA